MNRLLFSWGVAIKIYMQDVSQYIFICAIYLLCNVYDAIHCNVIFHTIIQFVSNNVIQFWNDIDY